MITLTENNAPLDFDMSLSDFFNGLFRHNRHIHSDKLTYEYTDILTIQESIGASLSPAELIYYPELTKRLRELKQLDYRISINLSDVATFHQKGLQAMKLALSFIEENLYPARCEKAIFDAKVNNLIYLYGQTRKSPRLLSIKPYYNIHSQGYRQRKTSTYQLNISGVHYYLNYHGQRFRERKKWFEITLPSLLAYYFEINKRNQDALQSSSYLDLMGGIIDTPLLVFRFRPNYYLKGKKYYLDLSNGSTYTRLADARLAAKQYTSDFNLKLIKD